MTRDLPFGRRLSGRFFRMHFRHLADDVLRPVPSAEGRAHYGGQSALYLSATPEATVVATSAQPRADTSAGGGQPRPRASRTIGTATTT